MQRKAWTVVEFPSAWKPKRIVGQRGCSYCVGAEPSLHGKALGECAPFLTQELRVMSSSGETSMDEKLVRSPAALGKDLEMCISSGCLMLPKQALGVRQPVFLTSSLGLMSQPLFSPVTS